jgi:putative ABC transport system permease protein
MDLKFALRALRKDPAFTLLAVLVMALGIGANTAVFSVVNAVLLRPLAYRDADRIVTLASYWKKHGTQSQVSAPDYRDWRSQSSSFAQMARYDDFPVPVSAASAAEYTHIAEVTSEFFDVFPVAPVVGRSFSPEEWKSDSALLVGYGWWQSHFGGSPDAMGKPVRVEGKVLTIVGVLPPGFDFPSKTTVWLAANSLFSETPSRSAHNYRVIGRLKPGVSLEQAQSEMTGIGTRLEKQFPKSNRDKNVAVTRLRDRMVGNIRLTLYLLLGAVGLVLLIACANVANFLLAKASARGREIAIRAAMGAGRGRIVRQLIIESTLLALAAGAAGVALAYWGTSALVALAPGNIERMTTTASFIPRLEETSLDARVLMFTFAISLLASLLFGLAPALHASRVDLNDALKQGAARAIVGGGTQRLRGALVVAEIAFSVVLLISAGLLIHSFQALAAVPLGFRPDHLLVMEASVPTSGPFEEAGIPGRRRAAQLYKELAAQAATLPGVSAAGLTRTPPGDTSSDGSYVIDSRNGTESMTISSPQAIFSVVSGEAFETLGIPLKAGRVFNASDAYDAPFTVIINESLARQSFQGRDPIGHTITCGFDSPKAMTIVGVAGDIRQYGPARPPLPEMYMPYEQHPMSDMHLIARTAGDPLALSNALRRMVHERSADTPVNFTTMEARLSENVAAPRFRTLLLAVFAGLALMLAMAGVYGVMTYAVGQRTAEIGLRMALGASRGDVLGLVLRQGMRLVTLGLVLGVAGALASTALLRSLLFEIKPTDPLTYAGVAALLALVALAATYVPARRAVSVDPLAALRQE